MSTIHFDSILDFIRFITFIYPEKKGDDQFIKDKIKELKDADTSLVQTIANNEGKNG